MRERGSPHPQRAHARAAALVHSKQALVRAADLYADWAAARRTACGGRSALEGSPRAAKNNAAAYISRLKILQGVLCRLLAFRAGQLRPREVPRQLVDHRIVSGRGARRASAGGGTPKPRAAPRRCSRPQHAAGAPGPRPHRSVSHPRPRPHCPNPNASLQVRDPVPHPERGALSIQLRAGAGQLPGDAAKAGEAATGAEGSAGRRAWRGRGCA